jgi:hypothetical protein
MNYDESPDWLKAIDSHTVASNNSSIFDDIGESIGNAPSFLAVSVASGLNSFYNTGVAVGNIFMDEDEKFNSNDTGEWISSYDDDLGKYYTDNKEAADITGFVLGALVPGLVAIKGLNAVQGAAKIAAAGQMGTGMRFATNLLAPAAETFVKREAATLAARSTSFSMMHANSLKSMAAGAQQGVLESLAFETAVAATMFKSPFMEDMDFGDIVKNAMMWTFAGGVLGGGIGAATTYLGVRRLVQNADVRASTFNRSTQTSAGREMLPSDKIMNASMDREVLERLTPDAEMIYASKLAQGETGESLLPHHIAAEVAKLQRTREANILSLQNTERASIRGMTQDDVLGNMVADLSGKLGAQGMQKVFFNSKELTLAGNTTKLEERLKEVVQLGLFKNIASARKAYQNEAITSHIRLHSGVAGEEIAGRVGTHRLADDFANKKLKDMVNKSPFKVSSSKGTDFRKPVSVREAELRWMTARASSFPFKSGVVLGSHDLPALHKAAREGTEEVTLALSGGATRTLQGKEEVREYLTLAQAEVLQAQKELGTNSGALEIMSNVRQDFIEGRAKGANAEIHFNAQESYAAEASKFYGRDISPAELHELPRFVQVVYDTKTITDDLGHVLKGMELIKHRQVLAAKATQNYFVSYAGELGQVFPEITEDLFRSVWRGDTGAGTFTNAGGAYGSLSSMTSYIGDLVAELSKKKIGALTEEITGVAQPLLTNSNDAIRFSAINAAISNTPERYVMNEAMDALIPYKVREYEKAVAAGKSPDYPSLHPGTVESIDLGSEELSNAVIKHIELGDRRLAHSTGLHNVQGNYTERLSGTFRPIRPDPRDFKHVAFVKDESIVGVGHTRMIHAQSGEELESMMAEVGKAGNYKIYTTQQADEFYRARGEWEYDKTLHENYIDTDLLSRGISANALPPTDPGKIVNQFLQHHVREENALLKQSVLVKYEKETNELKRLAGQWGLANGSRVGYKSLTEMLISSDKNPYTAQLKAMLNVAKTEEMPAFLLTANQMLDTYVSQAWNKGRELFFTKPPTEATINDINKIFDEVGIKSAYTEAAYALANSSVPRGVLSGFVRKANAFLTTTMLRLDAFNAMTNQMGGAILYSAEVKGVLNAIKAGSAEGAGELARISHVPVPGTTDTVFSPMKLFANSMQRLHGEGGAALKLEYQKRGIAPDLIDQYYKSLDSMTLTGLESISDMQRLSSKLGESWQAFAKKGEQLTGNTFAEQFWRYVAADGMKQITEVAVKQGIMDEKAAWMYVSTFNKRVNGVVRAAERPLMFQGPIGQAMGLFQSYQINLLQQVFRHVGEGNKKSLALMAGMQGSIFGASSLPGFALINSSLVGNASGNTQHKDIFSATQTVFGQKGADWLMYGAPSNILNAALYTRGDTNPRAWHIVPNPMHPEDLPFVSAFGKAMGSIKNGLSQAQEGAPMWESFLGAVEHLGISRPLAGIAQVGRGFSSSENKVFATQSNGAISGSNDLYTLASLIRVVGSKPIDEAITTNAYFRINAYAEQDRESREKIGAALKTMIVSGEGVSDEAVTDFAQRYVEKGGSGTGFNQWFMNQYKDATVTQSQQMARALGNPYATAMQQVMGGRDSLLFAE